MEEKIKKIIEKHLPETMDKFINNMSSTIDIFSDVWEEAQKERDKEISDYILCVIHGDPSYPNEDLRKGLEYLKDNLKNIKDYLEKIHNGRSEK